MESFMPVFVIVMAVFAIMIGGMSIGVILGRKPIKGSCGGVGAALGVKDYVCDFCGNDPNKCESQQDFAKQEQQTKATTDLAYDASGLKK